MDKIVLFLKKMWGWVFPAAKEFKFNRQPFKSAPATDQEQGKKARAPRVAHAKTLKNLLDNIEAAFEAVGIPADWKWSHTGKDTVIALRRMGPHVCSEGHEGGESIPVGGKFSAIMFTGNPPQELNKKMMNCVFSYAVLLRKRPWYIAATNGEVIYECGGAWRDSVTNKLVWGNWYVTVEKKTGVVHVCSMLNFVQHKVKGGAYTQKIWGDPPMSKAGFVLADRPPLDVLRGVFVDCYRSWQVSGADWKVSVSKNGQRVTWVVPEKETKHFFADRDVAVLDSAGRKKKIIHHVDQHTRVMANGKKAEVREHIRGLGTFGWRGYAVNVIAPRFHVVANDFDIGGYDENDLLPKEKVIFLSKVGNQLAEIESKGHRKQLPAIH